MPTSGEIKNQNKALNEQLDIMSALAGAANQFEASGKNAAKYFGAIVDKTKEAANEAEETADNVDDAAGAAKRFGANLQKAVKAGLQKLTAMTNKLKGVFDDISGTVTNSMGEIGGIVQNMLSFNIMAGFSGLFTMLLNKFQATFREVRKEIGSVFTATGNDLNAIFEGMEKQVLESGLTFNELTQGTSELANNFGMAASEAAALSFDIADGAKAIGVQATTMSKVVGNFQLMGDMTAKQSHELSEQVALLAAQNDVMPQAVMEDIASSTEEMAKFSKGGIKNFAQAAIQARKLGMSVKDISNTMNGLLNFEDSLNKELQASVMLGKNINLNEARRLAFAGDTAGAMNAVVQELGDIDVSGLDPLTLQSVADAAGVSTEQLLKMSKGADELSGADIGMDGVSEMDTTLINARQTMTEMEKFLADTEVKLRNLASTYGPQFFESFVKSANMLIDNIIPNMAKLMSDAMAFAQNFMEEFMKAPDKVEFLKGKLSELWEYLKLKGGEALDWIEKQFGISIDNMLATAKSKITGWWDNLWPNLTPFDFARLVSAPGIWAFTKLGKFATDTIWPKVAKAWGGVKDFGKNMYTGLKESKVGKWFSSTFKSIKNSKAVKSVTDIGKTITKSVKGISLASVSKKFKDVGGTALKYMNKIPGVGMVKGVAKKIPILGNIIMGVEGAIGAFKEYDAEAGFFKNALNMTKGAVTTVADSFVSSVADIGDWILPGTPLRDGYEDLKTGFKEAFSDPKGFLKKTGKKIKTFWKDSKTKVRGWYNDSKKYFKDGWENFKTGAAGAWDKTKSGFSAVFGQGGYVANFAGGVGEFFGGVKDSVAEKFSGLSDSVSSKFGDIKTSISGKFEGVKDAITTAWGTTTTWVGKQATNIKGFFTGEDGKGHIGEKIASGFNNVKTLVTDKWDGMTTYIGGVKDDIVGYFTKKGEDGKSIADKVADGFTGVKAKVESAWDLTTSFFVTAKDDIVGTFKNVSTSIGDKFDDGKTWITGKFDNAIAYAKDIPGKIANKFSNIGGSIKDKAGDIGAGIADAFKGAGDFLSGMFDFTGADLTELEASAKKMAKAVRDILFWPFDQVKSMFNKFISAISEYTLIKSFSFDVPLYGTVGFDAVQLPNLDKWKMTSPIAQDFIMRDGQPAQRFSPTDNIVGFKGSLVDLAPVVQVGKEQTQRNTQENQQIMQLLQRQNQLLETIVNEGLGVRRA